MTTIGLAVAAAGFGMLAFVTPADGFVVLGLALLLLGAGGGLAAPAAIAAIMGTVPPEQAGVGSALNDTIQQMGAALGVAILGSVLTSTFADSMPASAPSQARLSISGALNLGLADVGRDAFTTAMSACLTAAAFGVVGAAVLAFLMMRDRKASVLAA
jgi:DHA2 family multidrug resistance protein-like MFS transporter